jgi:hypothetical protein
MTFSFGFSSITSASATLLLTHEIRMAPPLRAERIGQRNGSTFGWHSNALNPQTFDATHKNNYLVCLASEDYHHIKTVGIHEAFLYTSLCTAGDARFTTGVRNSTQPKFTGDFRGAIIGIRSRRSLSFLTAY